MVCTCTKTGYFTKNERLAISIYRYLLKLPEYIHYTHIRLDTLTYELNL